MDQYTTILLTERLAKLASSLALSRLHQENNTSLEMLELAPLAFLAESSSPALELALT